MSAMGSPFWSLGFISAVVFPDRLPTADLRMKLKVTLALGKGRLDPRLGHAGSPGTGLSWGKPGSGSVSAAASFSPCHHTVNAGERVMAAGQMWGPDCPIPGPVRLVA